MQPEIERHALGQEHALPASERGAIAGQQRLDAGNPRDLNGINSHDGGSSCPPAVGGRERDLQFILDGVGAEFLNQPIPAVDVVVLAEMRPVFLQHMRVHRFPDPAVQQQAGTFVTGAEVVAVDPLFALEGDERHDGEGQQQDGHHRQRRAGGPAAHAGDGQRDGRRQIAERPKLKRVGAHGQPLHLVNLVAEATADDPDDRGAHHQN